MSRQQGNEVQLKLRFAEHLRARLAACAFRNGSSLNSEIVRRLEESFFVDDALGGAPGLRLHHAIAGAIARVERATGKDWHHDYVTFWAAVGAALEAMRGHAPMNPSLLAALEEFDAAEGRYQELSLELAQHHPFTQWSGGLLGRDEVVLDPKLDRALTDAELAEMMERHPMTSELIQQHQAALRKARDMRRLLKSIEHEDALLAEKGQRAGRQIFHNQPLGAPDEPSSEDKGGRRDVAEVHQNDASSGEDAAPG